MSGTKGVRAVILELATRRNPFGDESVALERYQEADAAIAELIEAAQAVENSCVRHNANDADLFRRLESAIARVKGGAA